MKKARNKYITLVDRVLESGNFEPRRRQMAAIRMDHTALTCEDMNYADLAEHRVEQPVLILAAFTVWDVITES
jgi:hypothetical protein